MDLLLPFYNELAEIVSFKEEEEKKASLNASSAFGEVDEEVSTNPVDKLITLLESYTELNQDILDAIAEVKKNRKEV